ncbi:MAG TPA: SlyX family protein [Luteimonas sp.]|nr:SlyX family protein [Luteimonas sp.]HRO26417.1 SlyX family protein [Luteimonas sp.]HRP71078.1 SlyX family protein [Luteimonas sp.]
MADDALEQRLVELEMRLAFQEQAMSELNEALTATRLEAAAAAELLKRVIQDLKLTRSDGPGDPSLEPPPPHY